MTSRRDGGPVARDEGAVVCGVDFSERASQAANVAAGIAAALGAPLLLVHVDEGGRGGRVRSGRRLPPKDALHREGLRLARPALRIIEEVHPGRPDEVLVARARACRAQLLVVASLGSRQDAGWPLGSVSE